jgi:hypothetical protein
MLSYIIGTSADLKKFFWRERELFYTKGQKRRGVEVKGFFKCNHESWSELLSDPTSRSRRERSILRGGRAVGSGFRDF